MSLPLWWPRVRCVYCGEPTRERDPLSDMAKPDIHHPRGRARFHRLVCWRHESLLALDPHYTLAERRHP